MNRIAAAVTLAVLVVGTALAEGTAAAATGGAASEHAAHHHASPEAAPMPGESLYRLPVRLESTAGTQLALASYRGQPLVVTMFYGSCRTACPLLTRAMTATAASLPAAARDKVRFLMVTLDPERDTRAQLARFAAAHALSPPQFEVARLDADGVRLLAAALGIRYRRLPDGNFSHCSVLTVLDADGVPRARTGNIAAADGAFVREIAQLVR